MWKEFPLDFIIMTKGSCLKHTIVGINTLRPRQMDAIWQMTFSFKCIFLNENIWISIKISMKFVPKGRINNIPALVQIVAWCRLGDKPLSEPMMVSFPMHICVTRPQWVKKSASVYGISLIWGNASQTEMSDIQDSVYKEAELELAMTSFTWMVRSFYLL